MRIYLAGKMGGRMGGPVLDERAEAVRLCNQFGLTPIDPAQGEKIQRDKIVDLSMDYCTMQSFVAKDEYAIQHCHALLILTGDTPSEGTGLEFGLALKLGIPVVVVSPKRVSGQLMGFWNIKASAVVGTIAEAVTYLAGNFKEACNAVH